MKKEILILLVLSIAIVLNFGIEYSNNTKINFSMYVVVVSSPSDGDDANFALFFKNQKSYVKITDMYLHILDQNRTVPDYFFCPSLLKELSAWHIAKNITDLTVPASCEAKIEFIDLNKKYLISFNMTIDFEKVGRSEIPFDSIHFKEIK